MYSDDESDEDEGYNEASISIRSMITNSISKARNSTNPLPREP